MPEGGCITIERASLWLDRPAVITHDILEGQYLSVCVSNRGTGMPPEVIAKVFDTFFSTKPIGQGTGLGLSRIFGPTVCLYLPPHLGEASHDDAAPNLSDLKRADQGETVLIVDDEPFVCMLVTEV